jgi:hypothetical protein
VKEALNHLDCSLWANDCGSQQKKKKRQEYIYIY